MLFASPSKKNEAIEAQLEEKGFGGAAPERTKNYSQKPSTSLFGGDNEKGEVRFQSRGGQRQRNAADRSPFGTQSNFDNRTPTRNTTHHKSDFGIFRHDEENKADPSVSPIRQGKKPDNTRGKVNW